MIKASQLQIIKFLKVITILSYCCIFISGHHLGFPLAFLPFIGLIFPELKTVLISILISSIFILFLFSSVDRNKKSDIYLYTISGIILLITPVMYIYDSSNRINLLELPLFIFPFIFFLISLLMTLFKIFKQRITTNEVNPLN